MLQYLKALSTVMRKGSDTENRTGVVARSYFGLQLRFNMRAGFPAVTTKKLMFSSVVKELLWFLSGSRNVRDLSSQGCNIWNANAYDPAWKGGKFEGDVGKAYGHQWRHWGGERRFGEYESYVDAGIDQIRRLVEGLKTNPYDRRHIVTAWNPADVDDVCLPCCHVMFQCHVEPPSNDHPRPILNLGWTQRSCDMFLGVPFNIASYALLLHMLAAVVDMEPGTLVGNLIDAHVYATHFDQAEIVMKREPLPLPKLGMVSKPRLEDFTPEDFQLLDYRSYEPVNAEMVL